MMEYANYNPSSQANKRRAKFLTQTLPQHAAGDPSGSIQNMSEEDDRFGEDQMDDHDGESQGLVLVSVDPENRQSMQPGFQVMTSVADS